MRRRNQKVAKWAAVAGLALALGSRAEANTTYTYTGNPFTTLVNTTDGVITNPYSTTDFIQVVLTTVNPLPPGLSFPTVLTPVGSPPATGTLPVEVSLQMTDGVSSDSLSQTTAIIVGTNGTGAINQWEIVSVTVSQTNGLQTVFGTSNFVQQNVQVALDLGAQCPTANTGCANTTGAGLVAGLNQNNPGTWTMVTQTPQTTVQVTPSPAPLGQPLTVSVTVPGTPTPTGSVLLQVNGFSYGNAVLLVNGAATFHIPDSTTNPPIPDPSLILPVLAGTGTGPCPTSNSVVIQYSGEPGVYPAGSSSPVCLTVLPTIAISSNPAVYGQPVRLSSMVYNPMTPQPNITSVVFGWDDGTTSPPVKVDGSNGLPPGQAQFQLPVLNAGTHCCVMATAYSLQTSGQNLFIANSNSTNLVINKANTATGLALVQNGSNGTLTATVAVVAPGAGTPTGTISFLNGNTVLGVAPVSGGAAMLSLSNFSGMVTAAYSGNGNFNGSASSGVTVNPPPPPPPMAQVSISSSLNPSTLGQAVTFSATVATSGTGTPSGSVQILDGGTPLGSGPAGGASVTTSSLAVGSHAIVAQYSGDGIFPAASASLTQVVSRIASTLTLSSSASQVNAGQTVTLTAHVGPAPSGRIPAPTGQVTFSQGGTSLGAVTLSGGSASVTTGSLDVGTPQFTAMYGGDNNYAGSSGSVTVTVVTAPLTITTKSLADGTVNVPYTASVAATGGTPPYKFTIGGLAPGLTGDATGAISGTPTDGGSYSVSVQVTDSKGATASTTLPLNIVIPPLAISATLSDSKQGNNYSGSASVSGGVPPYKLGISGLPPGLTASVSGASAAVSGQPTTAGSFTITVQATDSKGAAASKTFTVNIASTPLTSTVPSPSGGMAGQPYSQCVTVTGGTPPFTFSATLPAGLSIDPTTGCISGTPSVGGPVPITVTVTDSTGAKTNTTFTVTFALPALSIVNYTGLGNSADPGTQPGFGIALTGSYPVDIQGTLTLTFQPANGADTNEVKFVNGLRTLTFTIPASSMAAVFTIPTAALQTGTVAGAITITASLKAGDVDITPSPPPSKQIQVNAGPPVIVSVTATRTASGFTVAVTGYTPTREISQAVFVFNPAPGANLQTTSLPLSVGSLFQTWLQSTLVMGSQFLFTQPFTVTGNLQAVTSITVTLMNSQGSSQAVTATVQ